MPRARGFSLVELITVLLLVGILAVTVLPRFLSRGGFDEVLYRDRLIALLQQAQLMAMSRAEPCHAVLFETHRFGIPRRSLTQSGCDASLPGAGEAYAAPSLGLTQAEAVASVSLTAPAELRFDFMGRPRQADGSRFTSRVQIGIQGEQRRDVCVETEGYIHGC